jgi:putative transposase
MKKYSQQYPVTMMSKVLGVSSSGFYKWKKHSPERELEVGKLDAEIKKEYKKSFMTYGSPRIAMVLKQRNIECSKTTIARRMQILCITARPKRKYVNTTDSDHNFKIAGNLLDRQFMVSHLNKVWVSDITYVRVAHKWMYLTTMIDLADRMVVGWSLSKTMTTKDTVNQAFNIAVEYRGITKDSNLMVHSDQGVQYASEAFRNLLNKYGCIQSMSRKGNCWDNAVAESFFKTIKIEALNNYIFKDSQTLKRILFRYIDGWYNTVRIHSSLGGISPREASKIKSIKLAA